MNDDTRQLTSRERRQLEKELFETRERRTQAEQLQAAYVRAHQPSAWAHTVTHRPEEDPEQEETEEIHVIS